MKHSGHTKKALWWGAAIIGLAVVTTSLWIAWVLVVTGEPAAVADDALVGADETIVRETRSSDRGEGGERERGDGNRPAADSKRKSSTRLGRRPADDWEKDDPIAALYQRVQRRLYKAPEDVSTGYFLHGFGHQRRLVEMAGRLRPSAKKASKWEAFREAKLNQPPWEGVEDWIEIRFEWEDEQWKLEKAELVHRMARSQSQNDQE